MKTKSALQILLLTALAVVLALPNGAQADYEAAVLSQSPVGYWRLDDNVAAPPLVLATNLGSVGAAGNGTIELDMLLGVAGALPAQSSSNTAIHAGNYLYGNRVRVPNHPVWNTNGAFSVEFWCKPGQTNTLVCPAASVEFADPSTNQVVRRGWLFYQGTVDEPLTGNGWLFRVYNPPFQGTPQQVNCSVATPVDTNQWYHIVGTYKPNNPGKGLTLYVNGVSVQTASVTKAYENVTTNTIPLTFGARADGDAGYWTYIGDIDEAAFYPYLLSAAQVLQHYQAGTNNSPATPYQSVVLGHTPAGYWRMNEPPGPSAANLGSSADSGEYQYGSTPGVAGPRAPTFAGFSTTNHAVQITTNDQGSVRTAPMTINTNTVTMAAWIKPNGPQIPYAGIFSSGSGLDYDTSYSALTIGPDGGLEIGYTWNLDPATYEFPSTVMVPDGQWSFVAVTVNSTQAVIYAHDGTTFQSSVNPVLHLDHFFYGLSHIGRDLYLESILISPFDTTFNGDIDEVSIFQRALSMGEIYSLYAAGKGGLEPIIFQDVTAPPSLAVGETLSLSVDAGGTPTLVYQWRKDGIEIGGATGPTYTKADLSAADDGDYDVVIMNEFGTVPSAIASISVGEQTFPNILIHPVGSTVYRAGYVNLSVVAEGGNLKYYWQHDGSPLADGTSASYVISPADGTNAGTYTVVVSNSVGAVTSDPAVVNVIVPTPGSFEDVVTSDHPVSWWRLDEPDGSLTFADAMGRNHGTWVVPPTLGASGVISGSANTAAEFVLANGSYGAVPYSPSLNSQPITVECWVKTANIEDALVPVSSWTASPNHKGYMFIKEGPEWRTAFSFGDDFVYTYVTMGTVTPDRWMHLVYTSSSSAGWSVYVNGVRTDGPFDPSGWLQNNVEPFRIGVSVPGAADYDQYFDGLIDEVAVYNTVLPGSRIQAHYEAARFGTGSPPLVVTQPASQTVAEGLNATFAPVVEGTQPIVYSWSKDGTPIADATNLTLTVPNVTFGSGGTFVLTATNSLGATNTSPATLTVAAQPTFANLTNGLVLHLMFDGDYTDSTGRGNDGTSVGTTAFVAGRIGSGALSYLTTTNPFAANYVDLGLRPDLQFGTSTDFTIAFWTRFTNSPGDLPFFANSSDSLGSAGYTFSPSYGEGGIGWSLNSYRYESAGGLLDDDNWHHVLVSVTRAANIVTYVDGVELDSRFATTGDLDTGFNTVIGQGTFGDYVETGEFELDDLGVWRRALSPIEAYTLWYVGENYDRSYDNYGPVMLVLRRMGNTLELIWQAGTLEEAPSVSGPWTDVSGAVAPYYPVPIGPTNTFYRVRL